MPYMMDENFRDMSRNSLPAGRNLVWSADERSIDGVRTALDAGADVDFVMPELGLAALHVAIGNNDFALTRHLVENCSASFFPDEFGRWPTLVAAECRVDDELSEYVLQKEAEWIAAHPS